jgi:hypothetical protein
LTDSFVGKQKEYSPLLSNTPHGSASVNGSGTYPQIASIPKCQILNLLLPPHGLPAINSLNFLRHLSINVSRSTKGGIVMIYKRTLLKKILRNGELAEFALVKDMDGFQSALYVNGNHVPGPPLPSPLAEPKGDVTHWMGIKKLCVGLTRKEAEDIIEAVTIENESIQYRESVNR